MKLIQLNRLIRNELTPSELASVAGHLEGCECCREHEAELREQALRWEQSSTSILLAPTAAGSLPLASTWPPQPGSVIDEAYVLQELLGHGSGGYVFRARDVLLDKLVAIKLQRRSSIGNKAQLLMLDEARRLTNSHPNLAQARAIGRDAAYEYLVMDLIEGVTLSKVMEAQEISSELAIQWAMQVVSGLAALHTANILHLDVKPSNIMIGKADSRAVIIDLGLNRHSFKVQLENLELTATLAGQGSPIYRSLEQLENRTVDKRSDVFSVGVLLYELLTTHRPVITVFNAEGGYDYAEPAPPRSHRRDLPRDLETIVLKCLQKDPADRYADAGELLADLQRFQNHRPILAKPAATSHRILLWTRRNWQASLIAASVCCVSLVIAALMWNRAYRIEQERMRTVYALQQTRGLLSDSLAVLSRHQENHSALSRDLLSKYKPYYTALIAETNNQPTRLVEAAESNFVLAFYGASCNQLSEAKPFLGKSEELYSQLKRKGKAEYSNTELARLVSYSVDRVWLHDQVKPRLNREDELASLRKAIEYADLLISRDAQATRSQELLAYAHIALAGYLQSSLSDAELQAAPIVLEHYQIAAKNLQACAEDIPANLHWLAETQDRIGSLQALLQDTNLASYHRQRAAQIRQQPLIKDAELPLDVYDRWFAAAQDSTKLQLNMFAEQQFLELLRVADQQYKRQPEETKWGVNAAYAANELALLCIRYQLLPTTVDEVSKTTAELAVSLGDRLKPDDKSLDLFGPLIQLRHARYTIRKQHGKPFADDFEFLVDGAARIYTEKMFGLDTNRVHLARAFILEKRRDKADALCVEVAPRVKNLDAFDLACVYSLCAANVAATEAASSLTDQQKALIANYAAQAQKLLQRDDALQAVMSLPAEPGTPGTPLERATAAVTNEFENRDLIWLNAHDPQTLTTTLKKLEMIE